MPIVQTITPCLRFDTNGEAAVNFYISIFPNSKIVAISRYGEASKEFHGRKPGSVLTITFELDGQSFTALNGGPDFQFSAAVSFQINCYTQGEVDHYWQKLSAGGDSTAQQCGWLRDKFGLSWQVVPTVLPKMLTDPNAAKSGRAMAAMMGMKKFDIAALQKAFDGK